MKPASDIAVRGVGETTYQRKSGTTLGHMLTAAINDAISDAGLRPEDIDGVITDSGVMPLAYPVDKVIAGLNLRNVGNVGTFPVGLVGLAYGLDVARSLISTGRARHILFYFGVNWGSELGNAYAYHERYPMKAEYEFPYGFYGQPVYYATWAQRYAHVHGLSADELAHGLGDIAMNTRFNASLNKRAQEREVFTREQYLASPFIADPLRRFDCSLLTDGAGAYVVSRVDDSWPHEPVVIKAVAHSQSVTEDEDFYTQSPELPLFPTATRCATQALEEAGLGHDDIDVLEVYDCFTISVVLQLESLGFWAPGEGIRAGADGRTRVDGQRPVNTHGGLLSQGYLLGMNHMIEAVRQLRHEAGDGQVPNASTALVAGSPTREYSTAILGRVS